MKTLYLFLLGCCFSAVALAQNPVKWTMEAKKVKKGEYLLVFEGKIQGDWAVYSQFLEEGGPIATSINFEDWGAAAAVGTVEESGDERIEGRDEIFDMDLIKYKGKVRFTQLVKTKSPTTVKGYLTYMCCNSESCLPPRNEEFSFSLK